MGRTFSILTRNIQWQSLLSHSFYSMMLKIRLRKWVSFQISCDCLILRWKIRTCICTTTLKNNNNNRNSRITILGWSWSFLKLFKTPVIMLMSHFRGKIEKFDFEILVLRKYILISYDPYHFRYKSICKSHFISFDSKDLFKSAKICSKLLRIAFK